MCVVPGMISMRMANVTVILCSQRKLNALLHRYHYVVPVSFYGGRLEGYCLRHQLIIMIICFGRSDLHKVHEGRHRVVEITLLVEERRRRYVF
jgi:hypothetical protein